MSSSASLPSKAPTIIDLLQPAAAAAAAAKRLKTSPTFQCLSSTPHLDSSSDLTPLQKSRLLFNKDLARSRRNLKICSQRVSDWKSQCVKLEEILVEQTWLAALPEELQKPYALNLSKFVELEICTSTVPIYPPTNLIFNALNTTPFNRVKVVILGQDPYHGQGQAMGLSFSVPDGVKLPSSLLNIFKELEKDLGCSIPSSGNLTKWAIQGVLLLNAVLTVRSHQANCHAKKGWEQFTDAVIKAISQKKEGVVFLLWGNSAQDKSSNIILEVVFVNYLLVVLFYSLLKPWKSHRFIDERKHHILKAAHPSGLSAHRGFFGCRHFSRTNMLLEQRGVAPIDWQL